MPDVSVQDAAVIGGVYLTAPTLVLALIVLVVTAVAWVVMLTLRKTPYQRSRIAQDIEQFFVRRRRAYTMAAVLIVLGCSVALALWFPRGERWRYHESRLPHVKAVHLKKAKPRIFDVGELRYVGRRDGMVLLKWGGKRDYLLIRDDEIEQLEIQAPNETQRPTGLFRRLGG
jgi:hypothetical protein